MFRDVTVQTQGLSQFWKGVLTAQECFLTHTIVQVGYGEDTSFWFDKWYSDIPFKDTFPNLFQLSMNKNGRISDMRNYENGEWNIQFRRNLTGDLVTQWEEMTGIHGKIFSSDNRHPLPASVMIKGIDYKMNASRRFGDYHRILAPGESYEVTVSMPGYQPKMTPMLLEDRAVSLDFILDPEAGGAHRRIQISESDCVCNCSLELVGILRNAYMEVCLAVFVVLLFLYMLLKRRAMFRFLKQRHSSNHRRVAVV